MHLFYSPDIKKTLQLDEQESIHAVKVLRLKKGDVLHLTDGIGGFFETEIINPHPKKCELKILSEKPFLVNKKHKIHIAIAPAKSNERNEWFVEKAIEFGIDEITFINCKHSERKTVNTERMNKVAIAAMKQSLKAYLPIIHQVQTFENLVSHANADSLYIAHLEEGKKKGLMNLAHPEQSYIVAIGPEGDFTTNEINLALRNKFQPITLGNARLRTETAGLAACHILNLINEKYE